MLFDMSYNTSPTVNATGYFTLSFPMFEKVDMAVVSYDQSTNITGDMSGGLDVTYAWGAKASANNAVDIYPFLRILGIRRAAVTAEVAGKKFVAIAGYGKI